MEELKTRLFYEKTLSGMDPLASNICSFIYQKPDLFNNLVWSYCQQDVEEASIEVFSEYKRNGVIFRSHPNY